MLTCDLHTCRQVIVLHTPLTTTTTTTENKTKQKLKPKLTSESDSPSLMGVCVCIEDKSTDSLWFVLSMKYCTALFLDLEHD